MTNHVLCKMNDQWVLNLKLLKNSVEISQNSAVSLERPSTLACYARTGWDTCPATIALLAWLALKVLLNIT